MQRLPSPVRRVRRAYPIMFPQSGKRHTYIATVWSELRFLLLFLTRSSLYVYKSLIFQQLVYSPHLAGSLLTDRGTWSLYQADFLGIA
jgi:hypothetical protein